jgi:hypothetical protein
MLSVVLPNPRLQRTRAALLLKSVLGERSSFRGDRRAPLSRQPLGGVCSMAALVIAMGLPADGFGQGRLPSLTPSEVCAIETMESLQILGTVIEAYTIDNGTCPEALTVFELVSVLEPRYFHDLTTVDAWGTPFRYVRRADGGSYVLVSAGSDRRFEATGYGDQLWGDSWVERVESTSADIVFRDGRLIRRPICKGQFEPIGPR